MKPTFLIIGTQKGGTSAGIFYLNQHKDVFMPSGEPHFFDEHYDKGIEWYENHFFNGNKHYIRKKQRGEKTPILCFFRRSMDRIKEHYPDIKLIIFLRHPVARAYSQYNHIRDLSDPKSNKYNPDDRMFVENNLTFRQILERDLKKKDYQDYQTILQKGFYDEQLKYILKLFPKKNIKVVISERFKKSPIITTNSMCRFLGVGPIEKTKIKIRNDLHKRSYPNQISKNDYDFLLRLYKPHMEKLYKMFKKRVKEWDTMTYEKIIESQDD